MVDVDAVVRLPRPLVEEIDQAARDELRSRSRPRLRVWRWCAACRRRSGCGPRLTGAGSPVCGWHDQTAVAEEKPRVSADSAAVVAEFA